MTSGTLKRRQMIGGLGAGLAATLVRPEASHAQSHGASASPAPVLKVVDFHTHYVGSRFTSIAGASTPAAQQSYWQDVNRALTSRDELLASIDEAGIVARVVNTPLEFIGAADGNAAPDLIRRINDQLAELVSKHPGRLYGLATVDAYGGDAAALELTRAVRELGLRGVFVESAKGDFLLDAPQARPTLATAAALGIPVFVHPVSDPQLRQRFAKYRRAGITLTRSTINSAALIALIEGGTFDDLPGLRVVVTTLAIGALLLTGGFGDGGRLRQDAPALARRHVYIDTMGIYPVLIRSAVDMLGADHVLAGTDWPIFKEKSVTERLQSALAACGLDQADQQRVAGGNALSLLGIRQ